MDLCTWNLARILLLAVLLNTPASAQKIKVIVDQDARGPGTSDQQAILVFLQSEKFDVLGITTVSGDQWVKEETQHVLNVGKLRTGSSNTKAAGRISNPTDRQNFESLITSPTSFPPMPEGEPHLEAHAGSAAEFIVQMVHKYPGEVVLWAGGPLTNYALALKLDPSIATLAKEFVLMGGGLYADKGAIDAGAIDARREFNWWFDPEAARIVLRAPWKKMTITPIDISVKTRYTTEMKAAIAKAGTPITDYLDKYSLPGYMWDEIAGAALIDPSIITGQKKLYMDIDIDHGASYGKTLFWNASASVPPYERMANVQFDIDAEKFYKIYLDLMTRAPGKK